MCKRTVLFILERDVYKVLLVPYLNNTLIRSFEQVRGVKSTARDVQIGSVAEMLSQYFLAKNNDGSSHRISGYAIGKQSGLGVGKGERKGHALNPAYFTPKVSRLRRDFRVPRVAG